VAQKIAEVLVAIPVSCVLLYSFVRVVALAWFKTKAQFEN
jgi:hypothetical protein